jgi:hypothetical protein
MRYEFDSEEIEVITECLRYSSNLIIEQLFNLSTREQTDKIRADTALLYKKLRGIGGVLDKIYSVK